MRNQIRNARRQVRQGRRQRASWWFNRMRQVVDLALPPQPVRCVRAEQTYLGLKQTNLL